ncbi:MAG: hypothetical protein ACLQGP_30665, partial [Isosphaeraceae bacterium]
MSTPGVRAFDHDIGIDDSGAQTPTSSLQGPHIYMADRTGPPCGIQPPPSPRKYWTRRGIAEWLVGRLSQDRPMVGGIDHGFSLPLRYFEAHNLALDWPLILEDFRRHWPTDEDHTYVDFVRDGLYGNAAARSGNPRWRRLTESRAGTAKSVFHFDVQGSVAMSTRAGLPWLHDLHQQVADRVHFWPFDGWDVRPGASVVAEIYPSLWSRSTPCERSSPDQQDAYAAAEWMRCTDGDGTLARAINSWMAHARSPLPKNPPRPWADENQAGDSNGVPSSFVSLFDSFVSLFDASTDSYARRRL